MLQKAGHRLLKETDLETATRVADVGELAIVAKTSGPDRAIVFRQALESVESDKPRLGMGDFVRPPAEGATLGNPHFQVEDRPVEVLACTQVFAEFSLLREERRAGIRL